ncbi:threonine dehydratase [Hydrocarboniphaga effusa AP103]|uniref:L-threonine dehydratase n=1 Tax=Hydrocarboniphaga effusa AP103 TaxID=1172194 RepID=I8HZP0_9GAMM|nr:threonine dehydratase [Hydrocarboniphaga effusa AP103]
MNKTPQRTAAASAEAQRLLAQYAKRIEQAAGRVYDVADVTALEHAPKLSARLGCKLLLKREDTQPVYSFKLRGAYNKMASLSDEARAHGVVTASAGNHAQGVALSAAKLGIPSSIVMPRTTPAIKVDAVRSLGGKAILHGDAYDDALAHALELVDRGMTLVHPYDDPEVIAGQGTIAREILEQLPQLGVEKLDAVFVCVGGGGLLAGIAAWIKHKSPHTKVICVEPDDSNCMGAGLKAGRRIKLAQAGLFADGVSVRQAGEEPFKLARHFVDDCVEVSIDEICAAIRDLFNEKRAVPEPAGALGIAGVKRYAQTHDLSGKTVCAIVSGANINFDRLRYVAERAELGDDAETLLAVTIPEKPGSFKKFLSHLRRRPITEFNYRYSSSGAAHVFVGIKITEGAAEREKLIQILREQDLPVADMTGNEMAKLHVRFMVGGRAPGLADEHLFRFVFPERPGALEDFLHAIGGRWNISLFHYRNHGAAFGRVLCGLQIPRGQLGDVRRSLDQLGYEYWEETDNPAYALFLGTRA